MLPEKSLRKADFVTGIILSGLSAFIILSATHMPMGGTYGGVENAWYASPAAFPLSLGSLLLLASTSLIARAMRKGALSYLKEMKTEAILLSLKSEHSKRVIQISSLLIGYVFLLRARWFAGLGSLLQDTPLTESKLSQFLTTPEGANYFLSSSLFVSTFLIAFLPAPHSSRRTVALIATISLSLPYLIGFVFSELLSVPLP